MPRATNSAAAGSPPSTASASGDSQTARRVDRPTTEPALGGSRDPDDRLAIESRGSPKPTARSRPAASSPPEASAVEKRDPFSSPNSCEPRQLAAGPPIQLTERPVEGRICRDGDDEDVRRGRPTADR